MNVRLVPKNIFHDVLLRHGLSSVVCAVLDDSNGLNINYGWATIVRLVKLLSNSVKDTVANVRLDGSVSVQFSSCNSCKLGLFLVSFDHLNWLNFLWTYGVIHINVHQVGDMVQMTILVWIVCLDINVSQKALLDWHSWLVFN